MRQIYIPFRDIWFDMALSDAGAFHVTLGNMIILRELVTNVENSDNVVSRAHYSQSLVFMRKRLQDTTQIRGLGMIANIIAHICLNVCLLVYLFIYFKLRTC